MKKSVKMGQKYKHCEQNSKTEESVNFQVVFYQRLCAKY